MYLIDIYLKTRGVMLLVNGLPEAIGLILW